ncbi:(3,5-dihydroxyphenyl)acetyl-CoA 1,2-dioxygenase DpgC [Streptomyces sp. ME19-01-6]|uniref:(3,5-dihydroxyphenyl)acetyl-CoA 1,2-dioxygenase DpgC n=1 Tax=Streptomyces sp. ME19-01-6 TaxID=3028686 RepID=UPI0029AE1A8C|nr:(3,5-dihydroxyphenyl)acetyl-CoA 1,2-dioxygenase DpgC [Streptomyces sp. ME19-01-6]MDX3228665.1 enoyl-CoA hydratase/isomerase family protein [Streptomyces sp. ME19-01-6]
MTPLAAPAPSFTGKLRADGETLARYAADADDLLASLPAKPDRDEGRRRLAQEALESCRAVRGAFLDRHADEVYAALTDGLTRHLRLTPLVHAAAERFPGLVPTRAQLDAERGHVQADKEGREIDQGVFLAALLRSATAGPHLMDAMLLPTERATTLLEEFRRNGRVALESVLLERRGELAYVTINNQHCLNAEDERLVEDLETAVDLALLDDAVRVSVLRGGVMTHPRYRGRRVFCAGLNLSDLRNGAISLTGFLLGRELGLVAKLVHGVVTDPDQGAWARRTVQKPWIAAVDAFAIGGGMQLLLACDHVIAERDAYFTLPAAQEGIVPGLGNLRLTRFTGARLARRIILGGQRVRATDPEAVLLCDDVVPAEEMDTAIARTARDLAAPAVAANRRMLVLAEEPPQLLRAYAAEFALVQAERLYSPDVIDKVERRWAARSSARR